MKDATYFKEVCKAGQGPATCKYILGTPLGVQCAKVRSDLKALCDSRTTMIAQGDNCEGVEDTLSLLDIVEVFASPREILFPEKTPEKTQ